MSVFAIDDLRKVLQEAGGDESIDLAGNILDTPLGELGYDSLALLEATAVIRRTYGVAVTDETVQSGTTPRQLMTSVDGLIKQVAAV